MASMFSDSVKEAHLIDPGAGEGILSETLVRRLSSGEKTPAKIAVTACEIDPGMIPVLRKTYDRCARLCDARGIQFESEIRRQDFIEFAAEMTRESLFPVQQRMFNMAIANPPYRKIQSGSRARLLLRSAGIETSNLYTGFLALLAKLLADGGELVAITPRSFCNGPYFKPFRRMFLDAMSLRRMHVFQSRSEAFRKDEVLQENIIIHAVKSSRKPRTILISTDAEHAGGKSTARSCAYDDVVSPRDPEQFIHLVLDDSQNDSRRRMQALRTTLSELGVEVSTGRVVDFRARELLLDDPAGSSFPLIYPAHFNGGFIHWPKPGGRKPNAIREEALQRDLLVPAGVYVLVKRFSAKEEKRRVVACIYDPRRIPAPWVGFENHLNYFHERGKGLPLNLAKGLAAFLNSTAVDDFFRQFNGHTQVNATDLRNIKYPARAALESLGKKLRAEFPRQQELDLLVEKELF